MIDLPHTLTLLPGRYAICRLERDAAIPPWALAAADFIAITRTHDELSVVCLEERVPEGVTAGRGRCCLRVEGPFDLSVVGVLASIATPLASAGISIFVVATYDTDYVLLREADLAAATQVLNARGHVVVT